MAEFATMKAGDNQFEVGLKKTDLSNAAAAKMAKVSPYDS